MNRFGGTKWQAEAATVAHREVYDGNCVRHHATHGRKASPNEMGLSSFILAWGYAFHYLVRVRCPAKLFY